MKLWYYFEKLFSYLVSAVFCMIVLYLTILSMFSTSAIDATEHTYYLADNPVIHLFCISIFILFLVLLRKRFPSFAIPPIVTKILFMLLLMFSALWILVTQLAPYADQDLVLTAAKELHKGDFTSFQKEGYGYLYPHQHGIILFYYLLTFVFGTYNYVAMQWINLFAIAGILLAIPNISKLLFSKREHADLTLLSLIFYLPIAFYVTFVYGTLLGLALAMWAVYFELRFLQVNKVRYALFSGILISLAILLKQNNAIILIAMFLLGVLSMLRNRQWKIFALLLSLLACYFLGSVAVSKSITAITGEEVVDGVPMTAYLAMGLQEAAMAPGWYNDYNRTLYIKEDCDTKATSAIAIQNIKESLQKFKADPYYATQFFAQKIASEWNNPSFQCFWIQENRTSNLPIHPIIQKVMDGEPSSPLFSYLNILHTLLLFGALSYIILLYKTIKVEELLFAIIFIGGFVFHLFWEAKAQYTLPYFILILPYAVNGFLLIADRMTTFELKFELATFRTKLKNGLFLYFLVFLILLGSFALSNGTFVTTAIKLDKNAPSMLVYTEKP